MPEIRTNEIHFEPVGTLDELQKNSLSPRTFGSCSEPGERNVGCQFFEECDMSYKGKVAEQGGGPRNHGVRLVKHVTNGAGVREVALPCFKVVAMREQMRDNQTVLRVVASEGQEITVRGTKQIENPRDPKNPFNKPEIWREKVKPFPRPHENPVLIRFQYADRVFRSDQEEQEEVQARLTVGEPITEHMDVRHLYGAKPAAVGAGAGADKAARSGEAGEPDVGRPAAGDSGGSDRRGARRP